MPLGRTVPVFHRKRDAPVPWGAEFRTPPLKFGILLLRTEGYPNSSLNTFIQSPEDGNYMENEG